MDPRATEHLLCVSALSQLSVNERWSTHFQKAGQCKWMSNGHNDGGGKQHQTVRMVNVLYACTIKVLHIHTTHTVSHLHLLACTYFIICTCKQVVMAKWWCNGLSPCLVQHSAIFWGNRWRCDFDCWRSWRSTKGGKGRSYSVPSFYIHIYCTYYKGTAWIRGHSGCIATVFGEVQGSARIYRSLSWQATKTTCFCSLQLPPPVRTLAAYIHWWSQPEGARMSNLCLSSPSVSRIVPDEHMNRTVGDLNL